MKKIFLLLISMTSSIAFSNNGNHFQNRLRESGNRAQHQEITIDPEILIYQLARQHNVTPLQVMLLMTTVVAAARTSPLAQTEIPVD
jgi:hypothetical protein